MSADTSSSWLSSLLLCCLPSSSHQESNDRPRPIEKDIWTSEPAFTQPPSFLRPPRPEDSWTGQRTPWPTTTLDSSATRNHSRSHSSSLSRSLSRNHSKNHSFGRNVSVRRLRSRGTSSVPSLFSLSSSRRPEISLPTDFRHLHSETFVFPPLPQSQPPLPRQPPLPLQPQQTRPPSFHPLEISTISPLVPPPEFCSATATCSIAVPPPAHIRGDSMSSTSAGHDRSYSSMSFHVPRRPLPTDSAATCRTRSIRSQRSTDRFGPAPPAIPERSRLRSYSSPAVESMVERIAGAMIEMEKLQADIDSVIERQSLYISSRPSTAYGQDFAMPSIPAIPPTTLSFAERLSTDRPHTAPPRSSPAPEPTQPPCISAEAAEEPHLTALTAQTRLKQATPSSAVSVASAASVADAAAAASKTTAQAREWGGPRINGHPVDLPLAPPLPLVLRPPLRKKKSFSRVSRWLFTGDHSQNNDEQQLILDAVTNAPRPVTDKDGFYQCLNRPSLGAVGGRASFYSVSTVDTLSTWTTENKGDGAPAEEERSEGQDTMEEHNEEQEWRDTALASAWSSDSSPASARQETPTETPTTVTTAMTAMTATTTTTTTTTTTPSVAATISTGKEPMFENRMAHRPLSVGVAF